MKQSDLHRASEIPESIKSHLTPDQLKIYSIIWERFVSSQMSNAEYETKTVLINNDNLIFKVNVSEVIKEGFNLALDKLKSQTKEKPIMLPDLKEGDKIELKILFRNSISHRRRRDIPMLQ